MKYTTNEYLREEINYGGIATPRGEVIKDLHNKGCSAQEIDRYLQGNALGEEIAKTREVLDQAARSIHPPVMRTK